MGRFLSNNDVIKLFKERDAIVADSELTDMEKNAIVERINNSIIEKLSFLVYSGTKLYKKFPNYEDLVQEGFVGLVKATKRFNYKLFPNFFVFAEKSIKYSVKRAASRFDIVYNPNKVRVVYSELSEREDPGDGVDTPEELFFEKETEYKISKALEGFSDRDRDIVKRIFGLGQYKKQQTLRDIGPIYDLTHERVRQIKNQVITKLRNNESLAELY
jgi:RNA polymerase sigma factor (sigma-70 family)